MKSSESRQLKFVFADSPDTLQSAGASSRGPQTYLPGQEFLLLQAEVNLTDETDTRTTDPGQLLERVAWLPNLARALLKVASNKGAPGVDGDVPACLLDPLWTIPRLKEIKSGKKAEGQLTESQLELIAETAQPDAHRWSPEPLVRSMVATFEPYEKLRRLAKCEAYHRGFATAARKVFLGDGHHSNWAIQQSQFWSIYLYANRPTATNTTLEQP